MLFLGEFEHALDAKQRLAVPSELRACMPSDGEDAVFVAAPGPNGFLWLWPEDTFAELAKARLRLELIATPTTPPKITRMTSTSSTSINVKPPRFRRSAFLLRMRLLSLLRCL